MKKKSISLFMACLLTLSISEQAHALSLKERAQNIRGRAIALAKKGGAQSKKLWDKIHFLDNAEKEREIAGSNLNRCTGTRCQGYPDHSYRCKQLCFGEVKRYNRASVKVGKSVLALTALISVALVGAGLGLGAALSEAERQDREEAAKQAIEGRPVSPVYEDKP